MTPTIWHNPRCGTSRHALALLVERGHQPQVREYLAAGVRLVWVIDTATRMAYVYPHERRGEILTQDDTLSGEDVVEGFQCRVADLFAPPVG